MLVPPQSLSLPHTHIQTHSQVALVKQKNFKKLLLSKLLGIQ